MNECEFCVLFHFFCFISVLYLIFQIIRYSGIKHMKLQFTSVYSPKQTDKGRWDKKKELHFHWTHVNVTHDVQCPVGTEKPILSISIVFIHVLRYDIHSVLNC